MRSRATIHSDLSTTIRQAPPGTSCLSSFNPPTDVSTQPGSVAVEPFCDVSVRFTALPAREQTVGFRPIAPGGDVGRLPGRPRFAAAIYLSLSLSVRGAGRARQYTRPALTLLAGDRNGCMILSRARVSPPGHAPGNPPPNDTVDIRKCSRIVPSAPALAR
jgi:hypothetical protein